MVKKRVLSPCPVLDQEQLSQFLQNEGYKEVHRRLIWNYAVSRALEHNSSGEITPEQFSSFDEEIPGLPKRLNTPLADKFIMCSSKVVQQRLSTDGTIKLLIELQDGQRVEAVIIPHSGGDSSRGRNTLCVSSQIGCQMGCTFCATGKTHMNDVSSPIHSYAFDNTSGS